MKVRITFTKQGKGTAVPFNHQPLLADFMQFVMQESRDTFADMLNPYAPRPEDFDLFTFSGIKGFTKVEKGALHFLSTKLSWVISSPVDDFINFFVNELMAFEKIQIGELVMIPREVETVKVPHFTTEMKYIALSPVVLYNPHLNREKAMEFINPNIPLFSDALFESTLAKINLFQGPLPDTSDYQTFKFLPDNDYLERMKNQGKKYARIYENDSHDVRGYLLPFSLIAHPEVHNFIWDAGLGEIGNLGFGCLDLVDTGNL